MRLFVAAEIPEAVRRSLAEVARGLRQTCPGARWLRMEDAHLTLKFIGETSAAQSEKIRQALAAVRAPSPFELRFAGLGFFPDARRPRVFWAGIQAGESLAPLATGVEDVLAPLGIPRESRDFHPHVTLARFPAREEAELTRLHAAVAAQPDADFGSTLVDHFCLYQSILKSSGAEYTRLETYPLRGEPSP